MGDSDLQQNLRSSGTHMKGKLARGFVKEKARVPTIPSRYETVLNVGEKEEDGFMTRVHRFKDPENENPGPGSYHQNTTFERKSDSYSKKGLGSFPSKTRRFGKDVYLPSWSNPGPGSYAVPRPVTTKAAFSKLGASSVFAPRVTRTAPVTVGPSMADRNSTPGPGEYKLPDQKWMKPGAESANFKSSANRFRDYEVSVKEAANRPAPGDYVCHKTQFGYLSQKDKRRRDPVFRSRSKRGLDAALNVSTATPAPGQYDVVADGLNRAASAKVSAESGKPSSSFAKTDHDRFGNWLTDEKLKKKVAAAVPGPGQYSYSMEVNYYKQPPVNSSSFQSGSSRFPREELFKPPGPAYYSPAKAKPRTTKEFHLNVSGSWV